MTHTLPGTALVPVFSRCGGGVPGTGAFGYGRIASASAFEAVLGIIPDAQTWQYQGPTTAPTLTLHAQGRLRERAPWLATLPSEGWQLWQHWTPPVGSGRRLATLEIAGLDGAPVLIVCPLADGAAATLYVAPAYEGSRCWSRELPERWERWAQGRPIHYGSYLAPATPEQARMVRALQAPATVFPVALGFTEEERLLAM